MLEARPLNTKVPDRESEATGFGQHLRCVVYGSLDGTEVTVRVDYTDSQPEPTDEQRRKVANGAQRIHKRGRRLTYVRSSERYSSHAGSWESVEHYYDASR
jgi:hypothetical protein